MPEWNGMENFKNGIARQSSILPYQFHTRFRKLYLQKNIYRCWVVINNIVTEVFNFNIQYLRVLFDDKRSTLVVCIEQTVYVLHCSKYIAICSIDVVIDDFDRFDLFF